MQEAEDAMRNSGNRHLLNRLAELDAQRAASRALTEQAADFLISWIPMYFFIKVAFLVWCYHPVTQGAKPIYGGLIKPFLLPHLGIQASAGGGDDVGDSKDD